MVSLQQRCDASYEKTMRSGRIAGQNATERTQNEAEQIREGESEPMRKFGRKTYSVQTSFASDKGKIIRRGPTSGLKRDLSRARSLKKGGEENLIREKIERKRNRFRTGIRINWAASKMGSTPRASFEPHVKIHDENHGKTVLKNSLLPEMRATAMENNQRRFTFQQAGCTSRNQKTYVFSPGCWSEGARQTLVPTPSQ